MILLTMDNTTLKTSHPFHFLVTLRAAKEVEHHNRKWYGPHYLNSVTTYLNMMGELSSSTLPPKTTPLTPPTLLMDPSFENQVLLQAYAGDQTRLDSGDGNVSDTALDSDYSFDEADLDVEELPDDDRVVRFI
jgi:hypothetical protein